MLCCDAVCWRSPAHPRRAGTYLELSNAGEVPAVVQGVGGVAQLPLGAQPNVGIRDHDAQQILELPPEGHHQVRVRLQRCAASQHGHCRHNNSKAGNVMLLLTQCGTTQTDAQTAAMEAPRYLPTH